MIAEREIEKKSVKRKWTDKNCWKESNLNLIKKKSQEESQDREIEEPVVIFTRICYTGFAVSWDVRRARKKRRRRSQKENETNKWSVK